MFNSCLRYAMLLTLLFSVPLIGVIGIINEYGWHQLSITCLASIVVQYFTLLCFGSFIIIQIRTFKGNK